MGTRTGNATWQDSPSTATLITAAKLNAIESVLDVSIGGFPQVPKVSSWMTASDISGFFANSSQTNATGNGPALGVVVTKPITIDALGCVVDTLQTSTTIRLGIYSSDSDGYPVTLAGSVSVPGTATGLASATFGSPIALNPGLYWLVARVSSTTTLRLTGCTPTHHTSISSAGIPNANNNWIGADFGSSTALNSTISSWTWVAPDHTALVGMRRSA